MELQINIIYDHDEGGGRSPSGLEDRDERDQEDPGGSQAACWWGRVWYSAIQDDVGVGQSSESAQKHFGEEDPKNDDAL